ncbi:MAG: CutA1 divalent ion tolerance protein [Acidobacteria bacterium OLB17]|nr:MAG: CutA1 divalent ion tolerance protein [Acidobacteria bacterium OLB17]
MTTVDEREAGEKLASALVDGKVAACVQILPQMTSVYRWEGEVRKETEHLLLIKTTSDKWQSLSGLVNELHPYDVPELVAIDVSNVAPEYQKWLGEQTAD